MQRTIILEATPTLTVHANYVANDYVGTSGAAMEFAGVVQMQNFRGTIFQSILIDAAVQSIAGELWLFDAAPTPPADSAAWTVSDADAKHLLGIIPFTTYFASAANSVSHGDKVGIPVTPAQGSKSIYGCLVTRGAPAYASGDLTVRLFIWQD